MHKQRHSPASCERDVLSTNGVHAVCAGAIVLCALDVGVRRTIDDDVDVLTHSAEDVTLIGDIHITAEALGALSQQQTQL